MDTARQPTAHEQLVSIIEQLGGATEVARLLGVTRTVPYKWLHGERVPTTTLRLRLLDAAQAPDNVRLAILGMPHGSPRGAETRSQSSAIHECAA